MKSALITAFSIFLFAFSCENKDEVFFPEEEIEGRWNWEYSVYNNTQSGKPYVLNPDTLGFNTMYYFDTDGGFRVMRNTAIDGKGQYWFEETDNENDQDGLSLFMQQDEFVRSVDFYISGDTLILDETQSDGPKRYFLRMDDF
jgi:hypothetical protein